MKSALLSSVFVLTGMFLGSTLVVSGQQVHNATNSIHEIPRADLSSDPGIHGVGPGLDVFPAVVKRYLNVRVSGISSGPYIMGLRRQDGTLIQQWVGLVVTESSFVIDIEKVETGVLTYFIELEGGPISATFLHAL